MNSCPICKLAVRPKNLMCRTHWYMVPAPIRTEVWRAYHQYEMRPRDRGRIENLRAAQRKAIEAVEAIVRPPAASQTAPQSGT